MALINRARLLLSLFILSPVFAAEPVPEPVVEQALIAYIGPSGSQHSQLLMTPASTLKLLTATAATKVLGSDFRFTTQLSYQNQQVHLHMSGDPSFSSEALGSLLRQYRDSSGKQIKRFLIETGRYQGHTRARGQLWNDMGMCFASPVSSLTIDGNCIDGSVTPAAVGQPARLKSGDAGVVNLVGEVMTVASEQRDCEVNLHIEPDNRYRLSGCRNVDKGVLPLRFSINDERAYFVTKLQRQLRALGMSVGSVEFVDSLPVLTHTVTHHSEPLPVLLEEVLQDSNNLYADALFRQLANQQGRTSTYTAAADVMKTSLAELGLPTERLVIRDGSGLSRENLVSADFLVALLQTWQHDSELQPLIALLPVSGESGTLKYRRSVRYEPLKSAIYAKSGYVDGVINLAGFIKVGDHMLPFAHLSNGVALSRELRDDVRARRVVHPILQQERRWLEKQLSYNSELAASSNKSNLD
ncbi:D-alanyl-D-alanine carboxypeptidase/D-alanyl-D-alanine endopeptidase [Aliagarivorans marinus]|uniref:D-alanyl-D-alanine carboxypeptidase/D-alanyl-D-alanine endopeptidase n=1 Tax=Aliagarivorans marinus TaxID=561965 RepID=UPI000422DF89|nr:D-alanyl-D-alanine carboxypeptidase/D-alanyl-D-alanine-endopeptidase [Aliagarivorans marinus]